MCVACQSCQKAHLTCDDGTPSRNPWCDLGWVEWDKRLILGLARPCQRCIKRGLQESCQDGIRKKAKYLQDAIDGMSPPSLPFLSMIELIKLVADQKPVEQISPTMPPPNMTGSTTINPSFVQNTGPQLKYESQHYFKGSIPRGEPGLMFVRLGV